MERPFEEDEALTSSPSAEQPLEDAISGLGTSGAAPPMEVAESAVRRLEEQLAQAKDRHLRLAAEYDNFRKRVSRERLEMGDRAQAALVIRLLEVLDDLDRLAASNSTGAGGPDATHKVIEMVDRKLRKELEQAGLERVDPAGQRFDPSVAEAVSVVPPPAPDRDHTVSATMQVGYRFKGALVRPAKVQVYSSEGHA